MAAHTNVNFIAKCLSTAEEGNDLAGLHVYLPRFVVTWGPRMLETLTPPTRAMPPRGDYYSKILSPHSDTVTIRPVLRTCYCRPDVTTRNVTKHTSGLEISNLEKICTRIVAVRFLSNPKKARTNINTLTPSSSNIYE